VTLYSAMFENRREMCASKHLCCAGGRRLL
jgi:hypothetical protein